MINAHRAFSREAIMEEARRKVEAWNLKVAQNSHNGEFRYRRAASKSYLNELLESQKQTETEHTQVVRNTHRQIEEEQIELVRSILTDLDTALKLNFTTGEVYFERAFVRLLSVLKTPDDETNKKRFEDAMHDLEKALEEGFSEAEILEFRGDAKRKLGNFKGALSDYRKINLAEQDADLKAMWYARMARTHFKLKQYEEAIAFATQALECCNKISDQLAYMRGRVKQSSWQTSAESHFGLQQWKEALIALDKYLAIRPDKLGMRKLRAITNIKLENYQEAVEDCDKIIYEDGDNGEARTLRDVAVRLRDSTLQGPPAGMSRGEVPEPLPPLPPACNPEWIAAQGGYAGSSLVGTVFPQRKIEKPSAPPPDEDAQNGKVLKRQGSCRIL